MLFSVVEGPRGAKRAVYKEDKCTKHFIVEKLRPKDVFSEISAFKKVDCANIAVWRGAASLGSQRSHKDKDPTFRF